MSYRFAKGRAAGKHVKKIEWTETPLLSGPRAPSRALAVARARGMNYRTGGLSFRKNEFKSVDVLVAPMALNTGGNVSLLNGVAPGVDINHRIGREITMKSILVKGQHYVTAATGTDQVQRIMIVYDKQANATAPTTATVLGAGFGLYSPKSLENRKRFIVLYDRHFTMNASGEPGAQRFFKFYKRVNLPMTFNAGIAGTVADIVTGSLYIVGVGENAAGPTAGAITVNCRIRFIDA